MNIDSLMTRLDALERQNRVLWAALAALVLLVLGPVLSAEVEPAASEVRGTRIVLVDTQGTMLATLGILDGAPSLELRDGKGTLLRLGSAGGHAAFEYRDKHGRMLDLTKPAYDITRVR